MVAPGCSAQHAPRLLRLRSASPVTLSQLPRPGPSPSGLPTDTRRPQSLCASPTAFRLASQSRAFCFPVACATRWTWPRVLQEHRRVNVEPDAPPGPRRHGTRVTSAGRVGRDRLCSRFHLTAPRSGTRKNRVARAQVQPARAPSALQPPYVVRTLGVHQIPKHLGLQDA